MAARDLTVALVSEIFADDAAGGLEARLSEAAGQGAELAVLPELPMDRWAPATREPSERDAEDPDGPRAKAIVDAAAATGIAVLGGAIVRDPLDGRRRNIALLVDAHGRTVGRYAKVHLPQEPGFWEQCHYEPGREPPRTVRLEPDGLAVGVLICSDINRPVGSQLLAASGAEVILLPRATEAGTWDRWRAVLQATALTSGCYVVSVNRPGLVLGPEAGGEAITIGGPSVVVDPDGRFVLETERPLALARLEAARVRASRKAYPGYLDRPAPLYAMGWADLARQEDRYRSGAGSQGSGGLER